MYNDSIPTVSILLPIFNASRYLRESLDSLFAQSFRDFEIVAIDDGSVDDSYRIAASYRDARLRLHRQENQGLASTLNRAFSLARGRYIARQDADDIALPERLKRQVDFLDQNSDIFLLGTAAEIWEEHIRSPRQHNHPTDPTELAFAMLFDNFFVHSSVMLRREVFDAVGLYATSYERQPEDYELWSRVIRRFPCANLRDILQVYRECSGSICRSSPHQFRERVACLSAENLAFATGATQPSVQHNQIASLNHGLLLSGACVSFEQLTAELTLAATLICDAHGRTADALAEPLKHRVLNLRHQIRSVRRNHGFWAVPVVRRAREVTRKVFRRQRDTRNQVTIK
jgi:glycosyltransferase involved in cell wall biosynthesis